MNPSALLTPFRTLAAFVGSFLAAIAAWTKRVGQVALVAWDHATYILAVIWAVLALALRPASWPRTVRSVLARQILFTGVDAFDFTVRIAVAVGIVVIVQTQLWLQAIAEPDLPGQLFLRIFVRELGPFLANLIVIVRSGTAISTELAGMRLSGEVDVLDSQGLDPMIYLVMPRVLSVALCVFCLAVLFVTVCFVSGYFVGVLMGAITGGPYLFFSSVFRQLEVEDLLFFLPKTLVTGLFIGTIATTAGLSVRGAMTEVPQVATRAGIRSLTAVFLVSAILSLLIYGRFLIFQIL